MSANVNVTSPSRKKKILVVAANPSTSTVTGLARRLLVGGADPPVLGLHRGRLRGGDPQPQRRRLGRRQLQRPRGRQRLLRP
jgi:hypothetical protein